MKKALKAIIHPVDSLKVLVTRPVLSASRHDAVSDWCSVENSEDQEGECRRVRRVRFVSNAKKNDGVLEGSWKPSSEEVGGEVRYVSMPSDYEDGNFGDWLQHHQEDLEKRVCFLQYVCMKGPVEEELRDVEKEINSSDYQENSWEEERLREKKQELEQTYPYPQLNQEIDAIFYQEINEFAESEAARWKDKKIEKKLTPDEVAVIEDEDGAIIDSNSECSVVS